MNLKVELNGHIHKLPSSIKNFEELLASILSAYRDHLPSHFQLSYLDSDKENIMLQNDDDFQSALQYFEQTGIKTVKIYIKKTENQEDFEYINKSILRPKQSEIKQIVPELVQQHVEIQKHEDLVKQQLKLQKEIKQEQQEVAKEIEIQKENIKQENQMISNQQEEIKVQIVEQVGYRCLCSDSENNSSCQFCQGTGFLSENSGLIRLINDILQKNTIKKTIENKVVQQQKENSNLQQKQEQKVQGIHHGYSCDGCQDQQFQGIRYHCNSCDDFDFCNTCYNKKQHPHQMTAVLPKEENQNQLEKQKNQQNIKKGMHYKMKLVDNPVGQIKVKPGQEFEWTFQVTNPNQLQWHEKTKVYCIEGIDKGVFENIPALKQNEKTTVSLKLKAPEKEGKVLYSWKLGFQDGPEIIYFGQKISFELDIKGEQQKSNESGISCIKSDMSLFQVNSVILEKAAKLKELFGGDIKHYVEFIQNTGQQDAELNSLIEQYISQKQ